MGEFGQIARPRLQLARANRRLGDVIEDEDLVRVVIHEANGGGELVMDDEDVVREAGVAQAGDSCVEIGAGHVLVGLSLQDVAHGFERGVGGEAFEQTANRGIDERNPPDDACDPGVGRRHFQ